MIDVPIVAFESGQGNYLVCFYEQVIDIGKPEKRKLILVFESFWEVKQWFDANANTAYHIYKGLKAKERKDNDGL